MSKKCADDSCDAAHCPKCGCHKLDFYSPGLCQDCIDFPEEPKKEYPGDKTGKWSWRIKDGNDVWLSDELVYSSREEADRQRLAVWDTVYKPKFSYLRHIHGKDDRYMTIWHYSGGSPKYHPKIREYATADGMLPDFLTTALVVMAVSAYVWWMSQLL